MKILAFCGLEHHYLKLRDIREALLKRGHEVAWLISNNAINIDPASAYLSQEPFVHLYDFVKADDEAIKPLNQIWHSSDVAADFDPFWLAYSNREAAEVLCGANELIKQMEPDAFLILHENNFWGRIIAHVAKANGVPCFAFQEGLLRQSDQDKWNKQGLACDNSTRLFCWSEADKEAYIEAGIDADKIIVSGVPHLERKTNIQKGQQPIALLALTLSSHWKGDMLSDIQEFVAQCKQMGIVPFVRLHPREHQLYKHESLNGVRKYGDPDILPMLHAADVVLTQHSTIGAEAVGLGKSLLEYNRSGEQVEQSYNSHYGVAQLLDGSDWNLLIDTIAKQKEADIDRIKEFQERYIPVTGIACETIAVIIENELKPK